MKTDMAGAAALLGGDGSGGRGLEPPFPVPGTLGAAENMPTGTAYRPGDVLTSRLGKTVEVTNTDAEGRLVLGDVLAYAAERSPAAIIDVATLTGACIVALGQHVVGGLWRTDDALAEEVVLASRRRRRSHVADAAGGTAEGEPALGDGRHEECRRAVGGGHYRRAVPARIRGQRALGAPGHCRPVRQRQGTRLLREGGHRRHRAHPGGTHPRPVARRRAVRGEDAGLLRGQQRSGRRALGQGLRHRVVQGDGGLDDVRGFV